MGVNEALNQHQSLSIRAKLKALHSTKTSFIKLSCFHYMKIITAATTFHGLIVAATTSYVLNFV